MKTPQRVEFRAENDGAVRVGAAHAVGARARAVAAHARLVPLVLRLRRRRPQVLELLDLRRWRRAGPAPSARRVVAASMVSSESTPSARRVVARGGDGGALGGTRRHTHETPREGAGRRPADRVRVLAPTIRVEGALRGGVAAGLRLVLGQPPPRLRRPQLGRVVREEAAARAVGARVAINAHARLVPAGVGSHSVS